MNTSCLTKIGFIPASVTESKEITGGFCGDLLSWVMGKAKKGECWFTVIGNLNTIAVASLVEISAVVLCQGVKLTPDVLKKAEEEDVSVYYTELSVYEAAVKLHDSLKDSTVKDEEG